MPDPTDAPPAKWYDRPLVKKASEYAVIILLAWLASKGVKLPGETQQPITVSVHYPTHESAK